MMSVRLINIMPMAGEGKRFRDEGYKDPKPLIKINGESMFIRSAKCMPKADLWIFIIREEFLNDKSFEKQIINNFKNYKIISIKNTTEGQASTCYLAKKYLQQNDQIFISSCDNYFELNHKEYTKKLSKHDILVFTTNSQEIHVKNPNLFGWVSDENEKIQVSCKKQISQNPNKDRIIIGSFFFKNLSFFEKSIQSLFKKRKKINGEYYMDMTISEAISLGLNVGEVNVQNYISWGSHKELESWRKKNS